MKYESAFNAIDGILRNEAGCSNELDYIEQTSWLLFLKYLDDLETEQENRAELAGKEYKRIITGFHRWSAWAAPKNDKGELDLINAMTGDDLVEFVDTKLFPALKRFKDTASASNTLEYKIGEIFSELRNKIQSGYNLREVINKIDSLAFQSADDKHEMTVLYENKIQRMGNAGRNGGEYYTPRPLIRAIVEVVNPQIGETVYDPACGSAGFLCEAFTYMQEQIKSVEDTKTLQEKTFYGKEKKGLPYIIATMNMIFHGVAAPNIIRGNTLAENLSAIQERDRKHVILANPPFGGSERDEVKQNFDIQTGETAYMFMQHFIKMLKVNGRAGIVIKNTFLSNSDAASLRRKLLEECNVHTILDLPSGVFTGAGVKTVVLFFTKGEPTKNIWYYQLNPGRNLGKTNALNANDLAEFVELYKTKGESENSWIIDATTLGEDCDLSVKNPNKVEVIDERTTEDILNAIADLNANSASLIAEAKMQLQDAKLILRSALKESVTPQKGWHYTTLSESCNINYGTRVVRSRDGGTIYDVYGGGGATFKMDTYNREDCLVVARFAMSKQCTRYVKGKFFLNDSGLTVSPKDGSNLSQTLLDKILLALNDTIYSFGRGSAQRNLNMKEFSAMKIAYPIDPAEQEKFVSFLDTQLAKIEAIKSNFDTTVTLCNDLKQSILKDIFG